MAGVGGCDQRISGRGTEAGMSSAQRRVGGTRLLVLASTYPRWRGDPEPGFVHELSRRLAKKFHVTVLCPHAKGALPQESMDGVRVVRYRYAPERWETLVNDGGIVTNLRRSKWKLLLVPGFVLGQAWTAMRLRLKGEVDVVHAHWLLPQGLVAAAIQGIWGRKPPFVVTSHGADLYALRGLPFRILKRLVLRKASAVTVVSSAMRDEIGSLGVDAYKAEVLSMGVDLTSRFTLQEGVSRSKNELLFVGRLVEKKGLPHLLDAMPLVLQERPDIVLTIAGFGPDEQALRHQVARMGLARSVRFLGAVPQDALPALYGRAALFVAPFIRTASGDQEGLPVALMEAVACGCPALAGNVAGLQDIFADASSDCIVDPTDVQGFAGAILRTIEDGDAARRRALDMRQRLVRALDWDRIADRYADILQESLEGVR